MKMISEELVQAVLTYLSQRPYREVAPAMQALSTLESVPTSVAEEKLEPPPAEPPGA